MESAQPHVAAYAAVMADYMLARDGMSREMALAEATEVGKRLLGDGPVMDTMFELHRRTQELLAQRWVRATASQAEQAARERLVAGDAIPLLLALMLPHDLAQRAHHEKRWRRDNAKLSAMFEQTDSLMVIFDHEGQIDDVNPAFVRVTGWSALEAALGHVVAWRTPLPLDRTEHCHGEQVRSDGGRYTAEWSVSPIFGSDGKLINHVCIGRDVTRQQQVDDSLRENDKLRAVATLAAGIAHDFNNLLGSIIGLAELCQLAAPEGSRLARNLGRIHEAGDKAAALVRQLLDFSRLTPKQAQRQQISRFLNHASGLLRAALPLNVTLDIRVLEDGAALIDTVQMEQVLLNMARNAAQAMHGEQGQLVLTVDRAEPQGSVPADSSTPHRHVRLRISDSGSGIPPELVPKIFEPFFTTKPVGEGTGLGLAAVHGIVANHQGVIEVASVVGTGTTFSIFLPLEGDSTCGPQVASETADSTAAAATPDCLH
jgi:signal transduction histidine kinase